MRHGLRLRRTQVTCSSPTFSISSYNPTSEYYSQCQPGASSSPPVDPAPVPDPAPPVEATTTSPSTPTGSSKPSASGPGTTLQSGYYWIRAVAAPNFHKYMQTSPLYSPGPALLNSYTTAGQFQVVSGQLVQLISGPGEKPEKFLYAVVDPTRVINNMSLAVSFSETNNTYGTFKFGGDDLQWSVSDISRPNPSAWFVCTGQKMYINLGNYMYQTPAGCADQTIHYYNDKTANN